LENIAMNVIDKLRISYTLIPGYFLGIGVIAVTLYIAMTFGPAGDWRALQVLLFLGGGVAGWVCGILLSPTSVPQIQQFETLGRILTTFISGAILGKLLVYFDDINRVKATLSVNVSVRLMIPTISFLVFSLFSYMPRATSDASQAPADSKDETKDSPGQK
jgi:DMSO reductase anchor subunit